MPTCWSAALDVLLPRANLRERAESAVTTALDELYTEYPFYGSRRMLAILRREFAYQINRKRIQRLMSALELAAIYPKPNLSHPAVGHHIYPYLLRGVRIERVNQVWSSDITYIRMQEGFAYLAAVIDWFSRFVLSWTTSNTADAWLGRDALDGALSGDVKPEIFNTDQGSQLRVGCFWRRWSNRRSPSAWTAAAVHWTMPLSKDFGAQ